MEYFYVKNFVQNKKRNGIAQKKWTKINVQFCFCRYKVRNDPL